MTRLWIFMAFASLATGCSSAPGSGLNGDKRPATLHSLKRVYAAEQVTGCQQLGHYRAESFDDIMTAKEELESRAALAGADTIYFTALQSRANLTTPNGRESIYEASATAYRCK